MQPTPAAITRAQDQTILASNPTMLPVSQEVDRIKLALRAARLLLPTCAAVVSAEDRAVAARHPTAIFVDEADPM